MRECRRTVEISSKHSAESQCNAFARLIWDRCVRVCDAHDRYLSGEDPFLGYSLAQPAVAGIQSNRVIANAKHFVNNNQETNRNTVLEIVDERTRYEMYYPPFEGAANAGVGSVMCSCE